MINWDKVEEEQMFKPKGIDKIKNIFSTLGSAGANPEKLAKILSAYDFAMKAMGWQDKPVASLSHIITQYQASLGGQYHNDYKAVLIAEEIERKRSERKGFSIQTGSSE